ncbi:MAG: DUF4145 domain-containing protein, partial [Gammaproteobacteria bacterium]|nr:DUF4145 domain-containing protein [Gammaproteobacteria bacterium]
MKQAANFKHLEALPELYQLAAFAQDYACSDPQSALVKMRCLMEKIVGVIYAKLQLPVYPNASIVDKLNADSFTSVVPSKIIDKLHAIRKSGNRAAHEGKVSQQEAVWILQECYFVSGYFYVAYCGGDAKNLPEFIAPDCTKLAEQTDAQFARENKQLQAKLAEHEARLKQALDELKAAEAAQLKAQQEAASLKKAIDEGAVAKAKAGFATMSGINFNEAQTRARIIDMDLRAAGWNVSLDDSSTEQVRKEFEVDGQPTATGKGYADYVLFDDDELPLAVIEAKRTRELVEKGRQQAILYANALEKRYGRRPVIFYTNGYDIRLLDDAQGYSSRKVYGYYSKDSLQYLIKQRSLKKNLNQTPIDTKVAG